MTRHRAAALAAVLVGLLWPLQAQQRQTPPSAQAKKTPTPAARAGTGIAWVASYDLAIRRIGANQAPVILYFTYDG